MRKIFVVDSKLIEGAASSIKSFNSIITDTIILGIITLVFTMIWEIGIGFTNRYLVIILLSVILCVNVLKILISAVPLFKGITANSIPYVVLYDDKMLIITNYNSTMIGGATSLVYGSSMLNSDSIIEMLLGVGFSMIGYNTIEKEITKETDISVVDKIINNEVEGYFVVTYENVSFIKETKKYYYFKGTLLNKKNNTKKSKKFKLKKIYTNYEELKMVK